MRHVLIFSLLLLSISAVSVQAQRTQIAVREGLSRGEVKSRVDELPLPSEKTKDTKSKLCYDITDTMNWCYYFVDGSCRAKQMITKGKTKKDVMKSLVEVKRDWGQPVTYSADATEVKTFKQAVSLAETQVVVAFPPKDNGIALTWKWITVPTGKVGMTGGKYAYAETEIDTSYLDSLPLANYWE